jgi:hypothetical protein
MFDSNAKDKYTPKDNYSNSKYNLRMKHLDHARCSIAVHSTTRDLMNKVARKEQTYDDLIHELISYRKKEPDFK